MNRIGLCLVGAVVFSLGGFGLRGASEAYGAPKTYNLIGKLSNKRGYVVMLVERSGKTRSVTLGGSGAFSFKKLSLSTLKNASVQLIDKDGRYAGPVVLGRRGAKAAIAFSGKPPTGSSLDLGKVTLKAGYGTLKTNQLARTLYVTPRIPTRSGKPIGAGELGLVRTASASGASIRAVDSSPGADSDLDGVPNAFDADDDGDLVLDASDEDSQGLDIPYTGLFFSFSNTLNAHVRSGLSDEAIDAVVGGENMFSLTFFFSLSPQQSSIDGGYVECDDALTYCRRGTPLGFYGGLVESSNEFKNRPWSELLTSSGYPRMERISLSGGSAIVASIQPRVGRSVFRPGDVYRINLTQGSTVRSVVSLALAPYFVSIPALKEYNAGSGAVTVDYEDAGSAPGNSPGNPIVLSTEGVFHAQFWRPQREALRSDESGYYDWGNLNYGIIIEDAQATCAGLYSETAGVTESPDALGSGGSPFAYQGAKLSPLRDNFGDRAADPNNLISFTVDLKTCLARAGRAPGTYRVNLRAAGEPVKGGEISAVQTMYVSIP